MAGYKILQAEENGIYVLKFVGEIRLNLCSTLDNLVESITHDPNFRTVVIDLSETDVIDSTTLGLLAKIALAAKKQSGCVPSLISTHDDITRIIYSMGFDSIFIIAGKPLSSEQHLEEIPFLKASEQQVRDKVLEAHKILMGMNSRNQEEFKNVVQALEYEESE